MRSASVRPPTASERRAHGDPDFMASLARGLAVLRAFPEGGGAQTIAQIAKRTGLSRASVRRCLYTLTRLGYAAQDDDDYVLRPRVLTLADAYLSSASLADTAQPILERLRDRVRESCGLGILDDDEVVFVALAPTRRIFSVGLRVGSRLPAYCTASGRVLLAHLSPEALAAYLARTSLRPLTARTITARKRLEEALGAARRRGYAVVDQELEIGLRSIAAPVRDRSGRVVAALNVGAQVARLSLQELTGHVLPELRSAARGLAPGA